jgi:hypothetical protein
MNRSSDFHSGSGIYSQIYLQEDETWVRSGNLNVEIYSSVFSRIMENGDVYLINIEAISRGTPMEILNYSGFQQN